MSKIVKKSWCVAAILGAMLLASCGSAPTGTGATPPPSTVPTSTPARVVLSASPSTVKSDSSVVSTVTATVLDAGFAAVANASVQFSASAGQLTGASVGVTNATGQVSVPFSAGVNKSNQVATITATLLGVTTAVTGQIPILITGSTISLLSTNTNVTATVTDTLTVTVNDAGANGIFNEPITITQSGAGAVSISPLTANTDVTGRANFTVTGVTAGAVTLTIKSAGVTATQLYAVAIGTPVFAITSPSIDPYSMSTADIFTVIASNVSPPTGLVTFATTLGTLGGAINKVVVKPAVGGVASVTFQSALLAGIATVQASVGITAQSAIRKFAIAQPANSATQVALQTSASVVAVSLNNLTATVNLSATVRDVNSQPVGNAPVIFTIQNPTGGGEFISPALVQTNASGVATSVFSSGSLSTGAQGVDVYATVVQTTGLPTVDPFSVANIVIGGTAGSVVVGRGTKSTELDPATYQMPMSILVADSNGNAVANAAVNLKAWPKFYFFGPACSNLNLVVAPSISQTAIQPPFIAIPNEDVNRDLILNPGEDQLWNMKVFFSNPTTGVIIDAATLTAAQAIDPYAVARSLVPAPLDGILTPANSAAGTLPASVVTDASGHASFNLTYTKSNALWISTEITASTQVLGTETIGRTVFVLPALLKDITPCSLPPSPFNNPSWGF